MNLPVLFRLLFEQWLLIKVVKNLYCRSLTGIERKTFTLVDAGSSPVGNANLGGSKMGDPLMQSPTFADRIIDLKIEGILEDSWDSEEYLTQDDRDWLVENGLLDLWKTKYFEELVQRYQGSCTSLSSKDSDFLEEFNLFSEFEDIQFECDHCGWWCETSEQADSDLGYQICAHCWEEEEHEE